MENNYIHIYYIKQSEKLTNEIFQQLLLQLPNEFQKDINVYKHWESAQASLLGKVLLQYGFQKLNLSYSLHDIQIGAKDRPFINDEIDFNISHSGEYIIVAIVANAKVGVDIEKQRKLNVNLFRKYFDDNEWNEIQSSAITLQTFLDLWTIKESAIKCDGRGVEILSETHKDYKIKNSVYCDNKEFYFQSIEIENDYACCVCSNKIFEMNLYEISLEKLAATIK